MATYLVVIEANDGSWLSEPEAVEGTRRDAIDVAARKASGTVPEYTIATHELTQIDARDGEQTE